VATYLQMRTEVLAYGFDTNQYSSRINSWLNEAQSRIARSCEIPKLWTTANISTIVGTGSYTLASNFIRMNKVFHNGATQLELMPIDVGELRAMTQGGTSTTVGIPEVYSISAEFTMTVAPVPDAVYTLTYDYYQRPTDLSADGDISTLPVDYHDLMVSYTLARCYRSEDDAQMSAFYQSEYQRDLQRLRVDLQGTTSKDGPKVIAGTWGDVY
jgi:hypothetical protein